MDSLNMDHVFLDEFPDDVSEDLSLGDLSLEVKDITPSFADGESLWSARLRATVAQIVDNSRRNTEEREHTLKTYICLLQRFFAAETLSGLAAELVPALQDSIGGSRPKKECLLALKALALTILTYSTERTYEKVSSTLKTACRDGEEEDVKARALRGLAIAVTCGNGSMEDAEEALSFFLEVVESDGGSISADDSGPVVTAALQGWAFVASHMDDLTAQYEQACEAFLAQLDSTDPRVQIGAGTNIALLFESLRETEEETGESAGTQFYQYRVMPRIREISRISTKSVSKRDRKDLRTNFSSILLSLERGTGPGYSTAGRRGLGPHMGDLKEFGYRGRIRFGTTWAIINTWSLHVRVELLKMMLGEGLGMHCLRNPKVEELLESAEIGEATSGYSTPGGKSTPGKDKRSGRFLGIANDDDW